MYTEIELSEFIIRGRLKLGDLAESMFENSKVGDDIDDLLKEFSALKLFLNALNSSYLSWSSRDTYKRTEDVAYRYKLIDNPYFEIDWLDEFKPVATYIGTQGNPTGGGSLQLPQGSGLLYVQNGQLYVVEDTELTLGDI